MCLIMWLLRDIPFADNGILCLDPVVFNLFDKRSSSKKQQFPNVQIS